MKELWLEIDANLPETQKTKLLKSAAQACDAVLVDGKDVATVKSSGIKAASRSFIQHRSLL